jgi:hypothetical protein
MTPFFNRVKSIHFKFLNLLRAFSVSLYRVIKLSACKTFSNLSDQVDLNSESSPHLAKLCGKSTQCGVQLHVSFPGNIGAQP